MLKTVINSVAFMHQHKCFHCDLKYENILVDEKDIPHVHDFDLTKTKLSDLDYVKPVISFNWDFCLTHGYVTPLADRYAITQLMFHAAVPTMLHPSYRTLDLLEEIQEQTKLKLNVEEAWNERWKILATEGSYEKGIISSSFAELPEYQKQIWTAYYNTAYESY